MGDSGVKKCKACGCADIEYDNARGDAVCVNCGTVLEDLLIISEVQFEENAHGASSAVGQFVSSDSKGGASGFGKFPIGSSTESREVTLRKARQGITTLCQQLFLNQHCIETANNFFKMALSRQLTRGRRNSHIYAACVYITCRTEGTSHLLIDISDVLQICCYELGRTYLKLSQALCINIPSIDPCIYIMRFANRLEFDNKTHEVSMTAQRLVQRMKKDSIHSGRRPSGLCGAALLLAARMHDFNRTPNDIVKIVKIHESTLRKRLLEFGDTPSSALTVDEFMNVDLEAEQDPPAFTAARKKDKERLQKLQENDQEFTALQVEIDAALERDLSKSKKRKLPVPGVDEFDESQETDKFIDESIDEVINECLVDDPGTPATAKVVDQSKPVSKYVAMSVIKPIVGIKPDLEAICTVSENKKDNNNVASSSGTGSKDQTTEELNLEGLDDEEINSYILSETEAMYKDRMWNKLNAEYLKIAKAREERLAKEKEEGKPEKKKRRSSRRKNIGPSNSAGEAIEKMLQEKKISSKINYDILKSLTGPASTGVTGEESSEKEENEEQKSEETEETVVKIFESSTPGKKNNKTMVNLSNNRRFKVPAPIGLPVATDEDNEPEKPTVVEENDYIDDEDLSEPEPEPEPEHSSIADMLNRGGDDGEGGLQDYDDYEDY